MRFHTSKRRQAPAVIIVALIDVLIVLLIFLMVTTSFNRPPAVKITLPEASHAEKPGANEAPPLEIVIDAQGTFLVGQDATPVTYERLKSDLVAASEKHPDLKLAIRTDKSAPVGQFIKAMDAAKQAKIHTINTYVKEAKQ